MSSLTGQPTTEAQAFFAQNQRAAVWFALLPLLFVLNIAAVTLTLLGS